MGNSRQAPNTGSSNNTALYYTIQNLNFVKIHETAGNLTANLTQNVNTRGHADSQVVERGDARDLLVKVQFVQQARSRVTAKQRGQVWVHRPLQKQVIA